jgi:hypothetical protein
MSSESRGAAVLRAMNEFGIMNHLYASLLASIASAVQGADIRILKRTKDIDTTTNHQIAAFLVSKYMKQYNLDATMRCIIDESDNQIAGDAPGDIEDQPLSAFLEDWLRTHAQTVTSNLADLRSRLSERMAGLRDDGAAGGQQEEKEEVKDGLGKSMSGFSPVSRSWRLKPRPGFCARGMPSLDSDDSDTT